jgi:radical SAM protein with 4Fe4S-binding SPASM domain
MVMSSGADKDFLLQQSEVFCMAPWVHQYVFPDGKVFPCAISAHAVNDNLGSLKNDHTLAQIWNSEKTMALRANMLCGKKSDMCKLCYQYEAMHKTSTRQEFNKLFSHHIERVDSTGADGSAHGFGLKSLDFRFSNICNLTCRICSPNFSNKWFKEGVALNIADGTQKSITYPLADIDELWAQLSPLLDDLESIHFAGGEPLVMEEHYRILQYFINHGKTDVLITYNTNFSEFEYKNYNVLDFWKQLKNVSVCASLDGMGARGELMRKGISWQKVEANRLNMLAQAPHVGFQLTPTVSSMNVLHLPDFYQNWVSRGFMKPTQFNIYMLFEPHFYNIINLPETVKQQVTEKYEAFMAGYVSQSFDAPTADFVAQQFRSVLTHMHSAAQFNSPQGAYPGFTFNSYNQKLDAFRNENFEAVFPELKNVFST